MKMWRAISGNEILKWFVIGVVIGACIGIPLLFCGKYPKIDIVDGKWVVTSYVPLLQASGSIILVWAFASVIGLMLAFGLLAAAAYAAWT